MNLIVLKHYGDKLAQGTRRHNQTANFSFMVCHDQVYKTKICLMLSIARDLDLKQKANINKSNFSKKDRSLLDLMRNLHKVRNFKI